MNYKNSKIIITYQQQGCAQYLPLLMREYADEAPISTSYASQICNIANKLQKFENEIGLTIMTDSITVGVAHKLIRFLERLDLRKNTIKWTIYTFYKIYHQPKVYEYRSV